VKTKREGAGKGTKGAHMNGSAGAASGGWLSSIFQRYVASSVCMFSLHAVPNRCLWAGVTLLLMLEITVFLKLQALPADRPCPAGRPVVGLLLSSCYTEEPFAELVGALPVPCSFLQCRWQGHSGGLGPGPFPAGSQGEADEQERCKYLQGPQARTLSRSFTGFIIWICGQIVLNRGVHRALFWAVQVYEQQEAGEGSRTQAESKCSQW